MVRNNMQLESRISHPLTKRSLDLRTVQYNFSLLRDFRISTETGRTVSSLAPHTQTTSPDPPDRIGPVDSELMSLLCEVSSSSVMLAV
jgi:hypothetical protein